jgi:hypothetical protein
MLDRLHSRTGPEVPPDVVVPPAVIDEPTQKLHIITAPPTRVEGRAVLVYEQAQRKPWRLWAFTAILVALTMGVVLGQAEAFQPASRGGTAQAAVVPTYSTPPTTPVLPVTAPLGDAKALVFEVTGDATVLHVTSVNLGQQLYTIVPTDPSTAPRVTDTPRGPRLELDRTGIAGTAGAEIRLNARVSWTIRVTSASSDQDIDMRAGSLAGIELAGGTARAALHLPRPKGTVKVSVTGALSELRLETAAATPVRLRLGAGADVAILNGKTHRKVKPGTTLTPEGWKTTRNRYDVTTAAGVGSVSTAHP